MKTAQNSLMVFAITLEAALGSHDLPTVVKHVAEDLKTLAEDLPSSAPAGAAGPSRVSVGQRVRICGNTGIPNTEGRFGVVTQRHPDGVAVRVKLLDGRVILVEPSNCDTTERDAEDAARYRALKRAMETHGGASWGWLASEGIVWRDLDAFTGVLIDEQREAASEQAAVST